MAVPTKDKIRVLFVCMGNICRSPLAENVFRHYVTGAGLADRFEIDSAGTIGYHTGEMPDERTRSVAAARGITMTGTARQLTRRDFNTFDYIIAMDGENRAAIDELQQNSMGRPSIHMLREFDEEADGELDVPDPYSGGRRGFELVHDIIDRSCPVLLRHIVERENVRT
jgi:protein-tyrosine phosphatase